MEEIKVNGIVDGVLQIELFKDIDLGNAEEFYNVVMESYNATPANVCFNCEELNFIDSTTLGTFVKILKTLKSNGHSMKLVGLQAKIKKLFLICQLDKIIELA